MNLICKLQLQQLLVGPFQIQVDHGHDEFIRIAYPLAGHVVKRIELFEDVLDCGIFYIVGHVGSPDENLVVHVHGVDADHEVVGVVVILVVYLCLLFWSLCLKRFHLLAFKLERRLIFEWHLILELFEQVGERDEVLVI